MVQQIPGRGQPGERLGEVRGERVAGGAAQAVSAGRDRGRAIKNRRSEIAGDFAAAPPTFSYSGAL